MKKQRVRVPLVQEPYDVKGRFRFLPPAHVHVTGSYALGTCTKPDVTVDLTLEIPKVRVPGVLFEVSRDFKETSLK